MRSGFALAILVLLIPRLGLAQPSGPTEQTLVWWDAPGVAETGGIPWLVPVAEDFVEPLANELGAHRALSAVLRLGSRAAADGRASRGEVMTARPATKQARAAWVRVSIRGEVDARTQVESVLGSIDHLKPESTTIAGRTAFAARLETGTEMDAAPNLFWCTDGESLILASSQSACERALTEAQDTTTSPEAATADYNAIEEAAAELHEGSSALLAVYANLNAFRREFEQSFVDGRGSRLLAAWKLPNARCVALRLGLLRATRRDEAPLLSLDVAFAARSDAPGTVRAVSLTQNSFAYRQDGLKIPGVHALALVPYDPRLALDWVVKTHRAVSDPEIDKQFAERWRRWLGERRRELIDLTEQAQPLFSVGVQTADGAEHGTGGMVPLRLGVRLGRDARRASRVIGELARAVGAQELASAKPESMWTVPIHVPWLRGRVVWVDRTTGDQAVVVGAVSLGEQDPIASLPKFEEPAVKR